MDFAEVEGEVEVERITDTGESGKEG